MKLLMVLGGLIGFAMGVVLGIAQGSAWPGVFWRASVAALLAGILMRWWGRVWIRGLLEVQRERQAYHAQSEPEPASEPGPGPARA